jgi:dTDP-glucose 4,6-dehydratase
MTKTKTKPRVLVTGGAGFIGSHLVKMLLNDGCHVLNVDTLTYAGNLDSLHGYMDRARHEFVKQDVCNGMEMLELISRFQPDWIFHLAAETHVDRSIGGPMVFFQTNVLGTVSLLQAATTYWQSLAEERKAGFRFVHSSTDEVFGSVAGDGTCNELSPYAPGSPYSASKAASDHAARVWANTYGLPVIVSNCSNNYGPFQFPEKLIPLVITNALRGIPVPVYGQGLQVRDWLHVYDHCEALVLIARKGKIGETYVVGGCDGWRNIDLVERLCGIVQELTGVRPKIDFVEDRKGHDFRYSLDATKIRKEIGWSPSRDISSGLLETVAWYLESRKWWEKLLPGGRA